jgi:AraC-like DNA-binding protein
VALALTTDVALFERLHRRLVDAQMPTIPWSRLDASALDDGARERTRRAWSMRAAAEYRSMAVFCEMLARMPEAGVALPAITAMTRLVRDEARHTELCARVADALGGHGDAPVDARALRLYDPRMSARLFVARWTVSMFCVGESTSVALLRTLERHATDPCARAVLRAIRRDEALHDRYGRALAGALIPALSDDERVWLAGDLALSFAHYERVNAGDVPDDAEAPAAASVDLGLASPEAFARTFRRHVACVVIPAVEALGLPARAAWEHRHEAAAMLNEAQAAADDRHEASATP